jgi:predicted DNA-binding transcriptional regulator AlpA
MRENTTQQQRRWRRKQLAEYWGISDRTVDRMREDGRLGPPKFIGKRTPTWSDEQREAAERASSEQFAA